MNHQPSCDDAGHAHGISRRRLLRDTAIATGGAVAIGVVGRSPGLVAASPIQSPTAAAPNAQTAGALTPDELTTLKAIVARLIPVDALGPGADEVGVHVYIDRSLAGAYKATLPVYQQNLAALNGAATEQGAASFAALPAADQDNLLKRLEATQPEPQGASGTSVHGATTVSKAVKGASAQFFPLLLEHTRQGMFGDPIYGGNADYVGWDLIGYPGIKLIWRPEEQATGVTVAPAHVSVAKYGGHPAS